MALQGLSLTTFRSAQFLCGTFRNPSLAMFRSGLVVYRRFSQNVHPLASSSSMTTGVIHCIEVGGYGMTKYLRVCPLSSSSDMFPTNRRVELLRELWSSSASSLRDVWPVVYRCGSYCETSSFVGSSKYVGKDIWDP